MGVPRSSNAWVGLSLTSTEWLLHGGPGRSCVALLRNILVSDDTVCLCEFRIKSTVISAESLIAEDVSTTVGVGANLTCSFHTNTTYASVKLNITKSIGDISDFVYVSLSVSSISCQFPSLSIDLYKKQTVVFTS